MHSGGEGAVFTIDEHTEIACLWYAERPQRGNVLAMLMRQRDGEWHVRLRLRKYKDAHVFSSADEKQVFTLTPQQPGEPVAVHVADFDALMAAFVADFDYTETDRVELHTVGWPQFWERMSGKHYMNIGMPEGAPDA